MTKFDGRGKAVNKNKLKNLPQYKGLSDEELDAIVIEKELALKTAPVDNTEERAKELLANFEEDYDLTDLKINDREVLRSLIRDIIALEDYDKQITLLRQEGITPNNLIVIEKIQKTMSDLRKGISDAQNDLSITRRHRKSDQETSVIAYIESLKEKARKFYQSKMQYVFCEKCGTLLATMWTLYPEQDNQLRLVCVQKNSEDKPCNHVTTIGTKKLLETKGTNRRDLMPDSLT